MLDEILQKQKDNNSMLSEIIAKLAGVSNVIGLDQNPENNSTKSNGKSSGLFYELSEAIGDNYTLLSVLHSEVTRIENLIKK